MIKVYVNGGLMIFQNKALQNENFEGHIDHWDVTGLEALLE